MGIRVNGHLAGHLPEDILRLGSARQNHAFGAADIHVVGDLKIQTSLVPPERVTSVGIVTALPQVSRPVAKASEVAARQVEMVGEECARPRWCTRGSCSTRRQLD